MEQAFETAKQEFLRSLSDLEEGTQDYQRKRRAFVEVSVDYILAQTGENREEVKDDTLEQIYDIVDYHVSFDESVEEESGSGIPISDAKVAASKDSHFEVKLE